MKPSRGANGDEQAGDSGAAPLIASVTRPLEGGPSFSLRHRAFRALWFVAWTVLARWTPPPLHRWRRLLLVGFGAQLMPTARVYGSARVWYPPNLTMGEHSVLGPNVNCYCMDLVTIGAYVVVSQDSQLCGGTHLVDDPDFQLVTRPIIVGDHAWVAASAFVGPGVTVGTGAVLGARAVAMRNLDPWTVYSGNPAQPVRKRRAERWTTRPPGGSAMTNVARLLALLLLLGLLPAGLSRADEYRLQRGDVLEFTVLAPREIRERLRVELDGAIVAPLAGRVRAEGRAPAEVEEELRQLLAAVPLPPDNASGIPMQIWPEMVSLRIVDYRPVYVDGAVASPGAFPYSPGLTARQAIAMAGGVGIAGRSAERVLQARERRTELRKLYARRQALEELVARLRAEASGPVPQVADAGARPDGGENVIREIEQARQERADRYYGAAAAALTAQAERLREQLAAEAEATLADEREFDELTGMRDEGIVTTARLSDARRALLFSTTRQLQTATELGRSERDMEAVRFEESANASEKRMSAALELRDALQSLKEAAIEEQGLLAELDLLDAGSDTAIVRIERGGAVRELGADEDAALLPGDLVKLRAAAREPNGHTNAQ